MPATNASPLDTAVPGHTRRRVWKEPELKSHSLLVLTFQRMFLAPLAGDSKSERTVAAIENGADLDDLLGPLATVVELSTVERVKLDLLTNSLLVDYAGGRAGRTRLRVVFATPEAADACFTKLWRRLGDGFELLPYKRDWWALARTPVAILALVLLLTAALALGLSVFEDAAGHGSVSVAGGAGPGTHAPVPRSPLAALSGWLSWQAVCGLGGAAAAGLQVWLYRRLTQPPVSLELVRA